MTNQENSSHIIRQSVRKCFSWSTFLICVSSLCCRRDGDEAALDPEYENSEKRDTETYLRLGQPIKRPTDGEKSLWNVEAHHCWGSLIFLKLPWGNSQRRNAIIYITTSLLKKVNVVLSKQQWYIFTLVCPQEILHTVAINETVDSRKEVELILLVFLDQTQRFHFLMADLAVSALSCVFICITINIHSVSEFIDMCENYRCTFCNVPVKTELLRSFT